MKIIREPKGVVFTVTGQGLTEAEVLQLSAIIRKGKVDNKKKNTSLNELAFA